MNDPFETAPDWWLIQQWPLPTPEEMGKMADEAERKDEE